MVRRSNACSGSMDATLNTFRVLIEKNTRKNCTHDVQSINIYEKDMKVFKKGPT
jgi:hypothetical protein